jgi:hypothetical protein
MLDLMFHTRIKSYCQTRLVGSEDAAVTRCVTDLLSRWKKWVIEGRWCTSLTAPPPSRKRKARHQTEKRKRRRSRRRKRPSHASQIGKGTGLDQRPAGVDQRPVGVDQRPVGVFNTRPIGPAVPGCDLHMIGVRRILGAPISAAELIMLRDQIELGTLKMHNMK